MQGRAQDDDEGEPTDDSPEVSRAATHQIELNRKSPDLESVKLPMLPMLKLNGVNTATAIPRAGAMV
jgi:hypothetical protein